MSASSLPMMPVFPGEDTMDTLDLTLAEEGAYNRARNYQWANGPLPRDKEKLARIFRCSADELTAIWPALSRKLVDNGEGLILMRLEGHRVESLRLKAARTAAAERTNERLGRNARAARRGARRDATETLTDTPSETLTDTPSETLTDTSLLLSSSLRSSPSQPRALEDSRSRKERAREVDSSGLMKEIQEAYPKGTYRQSDWLLAEREIGMRLEEGHEPQMLTAGVGRYAAQVRAKDGEGSQFVISPARFFRESHFLEPFPLPARKATATERLLANLQPERRWEPSDDEEQP